MSFVENAKALAVVLVPLLCACPGPATPGGNVKQAAITQANAQQLAEAGSNDAQFSAVAGGPNQGGTSQGPGAVSGDCGGSSATDSTYEAATGKLSGTIADTNYCQAGTTKNGQFAFTGTLTQATATMDLTITFTNYGIKDATSDSLINGTVLVRGTPTASTLTMNAAVKDNLSNVESKLENLVLTQATTAAATELGLEGRFLHPAFGYVDLSSPTVLRTNAGDKHPSSGVLLMSGAQNSKARVTYLTNAQYRVEVDETGSGTFALVGSYDWLTSAVSGAAPALTSLSPPFGPVGTSVTLRGLNFSAAAPGNVVKFNGVAAQVIDATATQLVTTVPAGATAGRVTVTTAAGTGTSGADFAVTTATNAALAGTWKLTNPPAGYEVAIMLNPDNTYVEGLKTLATGKACFEVGLLITTATTMTNTVKASGCNTDPARVGAVTLYSYTLAGATVTTTDTTPGHAATVSIWAKQSTIPQLVGRWGSASASALTYVDGAGAYAGSGRGSSNSYEFNSDGSYKYVFYGEMRFYGCVTTVFTWVLGNASVSGANVTLAETKHYYEYTNSCNASANTAEYRPPATNTYPYSIEQVKSPYSGAVTTKLFLWEKGASAAPNEYPKQ